MAFETLVLDEADQGLVRGQTKENVPAIFYQQALSQVDPQTGADRAKNHDEGPLRLISNQRQRHVPWLVQEQPFLDYGLWSLGLWAYFQL